MKIHSASHQGYVRTNNEDRLLVRTCGDDLVLFALADGMGGHAAGERAAEIAVQVLGEFEWQGAEGSFSERLVTAIHGIQKAVVDAASAEVTLRGMGTTVTAALLAGDRVFWANVGDSRLYLFRQGVLVQVTEDHTIPGMELKQGKITREQARVHRFGNVLLKCVGCERFDPDTGVFDVQKGDLLLLSSDGMHDLLADQTIASILGEDSMIDHKVEQLVRESLTRGGRDNITVVGAEI